jgi:subtilisin family serine protease
MTEYQIAKTIMKVLDSDPPDIISLSAGYMVHHGPGAVPRAMYDVMRRLKRPESRTVLVAATGNDGHGPDDYGLFYPAAFAAKVRPRNMDDGYDYVHNGRLVAVGALRQDGLGRACFSNYGPWVTVYEEGENLINAFPTGTYTYHEPLSEAAPPQCVYYPNVHNSTTLEEGCTCLTAPAQGSVAVFNGMAAWSGTSFATPIVAARIARHMTENEVHGKPQEAVQAVQDLLGQLGTITDAGDGTTQLPVFSKPAVP